MIIRTRCISVALALSLLTMEAVAQIASSTEGAIVGTVTDSSGATLPGVKVILSGPAVMGQPSALTDQSGHYSFPALQVGDYKLTFEETGFGGQTREGIHISLGFTATVNVQMAPGAVSESVTVSGGAATIDLEASTVTTSVGSESIKSLPGSRDYWMVLAVSPALSLSRMDVGGSAAITQQAYNAYGLTAGSGVSRGEIEGLMVNENSGGGGSDMTYTDIGAMEEVSVNAVGNTAEMPNPGVLGQLIVKSGGNKYHGDVYFDYENQAMEATNINQKQIALGLVGSAAVPATDLNRLSEFRDLDVDTGGFIIKDKLWWYGSFRDTFTGQRYPTLTNDIQDTSLYVYTIKVNYALTSHQKVIGFFQHGVKHQPDYLGSLVISPTGRTTPALNTSQTLWNSYSPVHLWKFEYDYVINSALLFEARAGTFYDPWHRTAKSSLPRVEDISTDYVSGGVYGTSDLSSRPQTSSSLTYMKNGWLGTHTFKFGGEYMRDTQTLPFTGFLNSCECVSVLNNGTPLDVYIYQGPNSSSSGNSSVGLYINDTWRISQRLTLNLGLRNDRQNIFFSPQQGPSGQTFAAVNNAITWNKLLGPRFGLAYDLTGRSSTVLKASFGKFFIYPGGDFGANFNPNASGWYTEYKWSDPGCTGDGNCVFAPGQQGSVIASKGGSASTALDPNLKLTYVLQGTGYIEQQLGRQILLRTGYVLNGRRDVLGSVNVNRPLSAYNVPVTVNIPGANGVAAAGSPTVTAYGLASAYLSLPVLNLTTNLPENSNYYTWETSVIKRDTGGRWGLLASFAETWANETPLGTGTSFTPNQLINTQGGRNLYDLWEAKIVGTLRLPWGIKMTPMLRVQSGTPFGRTFTQSLNFGSATILTQPYDGERTPNIAIFDVRTEKTFRIRERYSVTGFLDLYNIFNTNAAQAVTTASGSAFLLPSAITAPRILRLGVKFQF